MEHRQERIDTAARRWEIPMDPDRRASLLRFADWLETEAIVAGGLGPAEGERILDRHVLDSLTYLRGFPPDARTVLDVGGGVGLPAIPVAIARPDLAVTLVDRAERRTRLAGRAARILGLDNLEIRTAAVEDVRGPFDVLTFRASLTVERAAAAVLRLTTGGGVGVFGVSRREVRPTVPNPPAGVTFSLSAEGNGVLDSPFWLLRMQHI